MKAPALNLTGSGVLATAALALVAGLGVMLWVRRGDIARAASGAAAAVNPADSRNLVNRGVSAVGEAVTGEQGWSLGGALAEVFSPSVRAANAMVRARPAVPDTGDEVARLVRRYGANSTGGEGVFSGAVLRSPEEP